MIQGINNWNLLGQTYDAGRGKEQLIRNAVSELKDREIHMDSACFSREGMQAMRTKVQEMPGHIDVEEMIRMREILPKLKVNPEDEFLWAMRNDMQSSLDRIKQSGGSYTLDDLISIRMKSYTTQYDALQKSYEDGSRDVYISDGVDENGKLQYHKVTETEDFGYLKEAFDRVADSLKLSAKSQEIQWQINEKFYGESKLPVSLPDGYDEKLADILKQAAFEYADQREKGQYADAVGLAFRYLNQDPEFANAVRTLFSNIKPMTD